MDFKKERQVSDWLKQLPVGNLPEDDETPVLVLGKSLAATLGVSVGDTVSVLIPSAHLTPVGLWPRVKTFKIGGLFDSGLYKFDSSTALVSLGLAQKIFNLPAKVSYLQVRIKDIFQAGQLAEKIQQLTGPGIYVTTWMELNRSLFSALKLERPALSHHYPDCRRGCSEYYCQPGSAGDGKDQGYWPYDCYGGQSQPDKKSIFLAGSNNRAGRDNNRYGPRSFLVLAGQYFQTDQAPSRYLSNCLCAFPAKAS